MAEVSAPVSIVTAARALGISESQLRRYVASGAPVAHRGARGRGRATLLDPSAIEAWRRAGAGDDRLVVLAAELPELIASAIHSAFLSTDGPHKRATAGALAGVWYLVTTAVLDRLRREVPELGELTTVPDKIAALRVIFRDSGTVGPSRHDEER